MQWKSWRSRVETGEFASVLDTLHKLSSLLQNKHQWLQSRHDLSTLGVIAFKYTGFVKCNVFLRQKVRSGANPASCTPSKELQRLITLPQIRFSILTAALLSFLTSFDEVIISIFISGGVNATLTKQMFSALRDYIDPTIAAISTIMVFISTILLLATQFFEARKDKK